MPSLHRKFGQRLWPYCCRVVGIVAALQIIANVALAANRILICSMTSAGALHLAEATSQWQMQDDKAVILVGEK